MVTGPQVARLRKALGGADTDEVGLASTHWRACSEILETVSQYLRAASPQVRWAIGGETGPAVDAAFAKSADAMVERAKLLTEGSGALESASGAITTAKDAEAALQDLAQPTPYRAPVGNPTDDELHQQAQSKAREQAFATAYAAQEEKARAHADALDEAFARSTETMKRIHGEPDPVPPPPPPPSGGGASGNGGTSGGRTGHDVAVLTIGPQTGGPGHVAGPAHGQEPATHDVPGAGGHPGLPGGSTPDVAFPGATVSAEGGGPGLGVAGATAGGAAAGLIGAKLGGALKGGLFPGAATSGASGTVTRGTAASAVRGIGSSARSGSASTLGRTSGGSGSAGATGRAGSAGSTGRPGARSGTGSGTRSGAGARAGTGASGRTGRTKDDEKGRKRELFDVGEDWVDDEGAAPGVLD